MKKTTFDEMMSRMKKESGHRKRPSDEEHRIQCTCVR